MQQEVAPASSTPRDRSPRREARPNLATRSTVLSLPASAAAFISSRAAAKSFPSAAAFLTASQAG